MDAPGRLHALLPGNGRVLATSARIDGLTCDMPQHRIFHVAFLEKKKNAICLNYCLNSTLFSERP